MGQEEELDPNDLRELARRVRVIAAGADETEGRRLLSYASELEALAVSLERKKPN